MQSVWAVRGIRKLLAMAVLLCGVSPWAAKAQLMSLPYVIPTDFTVASTYTFNSCDNFPVLITCIFGNAAFGQQTSTGLFGVIAGFGSYVVGPLPPDARAIAFACGIDLTGVNGQRVVDGSDGGPCGGILPAQFYSPLLDAHSTLKNVLVQGDIEGPEFTNGLVFPRATLVLTPEPGTLALFGTGLIPLAAVVRRRRKLR